MKKLIITAILATILPVFLANAEDKNDNGNPPNGKPKQCQGKGQGGKCNGKNGNGKPKKGGKPGDGGVPMK